MSPNVLACSSQTWIYVHRSSQRCLVGKLWWTAGADDCEKASHLDTRTWKGGIWLFGACWRAWKTETRRVRFSHQIVSFWDKTQGPSFWDFSRWRDNFWTLAPARPLGPVLATVRARLHLLGHWLRERLLVKWSSWWKPTPQVVLPFLYGCTHTKDTENL